MLNTAKASSSPTVGASTGCFLRVRPSGAGTGVMGRPGLRAARGAFEGVSVVACGALRTATEGEGGVCCCWRGPRTTAMHGDEWGPMRWIGAIRDLRPPAVAAVAERLGGSRRLRREEPMWRLWVSREGMEGGCIRGTSVGWASAG